MAGLSVVLEGYKGFGNKISSSNSTIHPQVISKATMNKPAAPLSSTFPASARTSGFLDHCFLCKKKLLPSEDIYMYKGDRAFCSEECRCRQIFRDEEETLKGKTDIYSLAAIKPQQTSNSAAASRGRSRGARNQANGFAHNL